MIILGHPWIQSETLRKVSTKEQIMQSSPKEIILLESFEKAHLLALYCQENAISYGIYIKSIKEAIFANALGAKYIICKEGDAKKIQTIATDYLFDTSILVPIEDENKISELATYGIDGVVFKTAISPS